MNPLYLEEALALAEIDGEEGDRETLLLEEDGEAAGTALVAGAVDLHEVAPGRFATRSAKSFTTMSGSSS